MVVYERNFTNWHISAISRTNKALIGFVFMAFMGSVNADDVTFSIEAQRMDRALLQFAETADVQIAFAPLIAMNSSSAAVKGRHSLPQALDLLLTGTDLDYRFVSDDFIVVNQQNYVPRKFSASRTGAKQNYGTQLAQLQQSSRDIVTSAVRDQSEVEEAGTNTIEEIVVTARKREENLQDVPISISVVSQNDIEARQITSLRDLGAFTPNFTFYNSSDTGQNSAVIFIRGVGQSGYNIYMDPGVGVYLDGVYLGRMQGVDLDLADLERVEVLRGPQGTLFGMNTMGGAINMVSARPKDEFSGNVKITVGSFSRLDGQASVNIPLVPGKLKAKFSAATRNRDGFGKRLDFSTGQKIDGMGNVDRLSGRALFDWTPTDRVDVQLSVDASKIRQAGPVRKATALSQPPIIAFLNNFVTPPFGNAFMTNSDFTNYSTGGNTNNLDFWGAALTMNWDLGGWAVKSITSYRKMDDLNDVDPDMTPYQIINLRNIDTQKQVSQEFQVSGVSFNGRLRWVGGLYYFGEDASLNQVTGVMRDLYDFIGLNLSVAINQRAKAQHYATYGQGTYAINDKLSFTAGMRYTYDEKEVGRELSGRYIVPWGSKSDNWGDSTGRLGMEYAWDHDLMTYVSVAQGFKSGGIFGHATSDDAFQSYDPEHILTYEIGLKSDFLDRRLRLNAALFYSAYKDIQFRYTTADPETLAIITTMGNVAQARVQGLEVELVAIPARGLTLSAGVGFTDAKYTEAGAISPVNTNSKFVMTPKLTSNLSVQYVAAAKGLGEFAGRVDYGYRSKVYFDLPNSPLAIQDGFGLLNASLTFTTPNRNWSVSMFFNNVADKRYVLTADDLTNALGFAEAQYAPPREWGLKVVYEY